MPTYPSWHYEGTDKEGAPFSLCTHFSLTIHGFQTIMQHECYNKGSMIQMSVCITAKAARRMHHAWLKLFVRGKCPDCVEDILFGTKHGKFATVIYPRSTKRRAGYV